MTRVIGNFELFIGRESLEELVVRMKALSFESGLFLVDRNVSSHFRVLEILNTLNSQGFKLDFHEIAFSGEPTYGDLDREFKSLPNNNPDFIVSIGGGSLLDLSKGISVLMTNGGPGINYRGMHKVPRSGTPLILFPTTAGTGTEMTWTASFIDTKSGVKMGINGDNMFPKISVVDPMLLVGAPKNVLMSSALDVLVHAIEAVTSKMSSPFTVSLGIIAVRRVLENLVPSLRSEPSIESLELLQLAAAEAGLAMLNSSGGPASGISYPLGVHYKVPHGFAGGLLLPAVIEENISMGYKGYSVFEDEAKGGKAFLERIEELFLEIEAPSNFETWGFDSKGDLELIVKYTLEQRAENLILNPIAFSEENVRTVLERFV
jgi:alcohol dehydrogenase